jgi:hypothetical protein
MEGTSSLAKAGLIDVTRRHGAQATGIAPRSRPSFPSTARGVRGLDRRSSRKPIRLRRSSPLSRKRKRRGARSTRSRRCAVKRAAVGGRMTERRSGRARGRRWRHLSRKRSRSRRAAGFPTLPGGQSPKGMFATGARGANVGCRSGFEASWRCDRGKPQGPTRAPRRATWKAAGLDETGRRSPRRRVPESRKRIAASDLKLGESR